MTEPRDLESCLDRPALMVRSQIDPRTGYKTIYGYFGQRIAVLKGTVVELYGHGPHAPPSNVYKRYHLFKAEWPEDWGVISCYFSIRET